MKVAQVLDTSSRLAGGLFESVKGLSLALMERGDDVVVLSGTDKWSETELPSWGKARPRLVRSSGLIDGIMARALTREILDTDADIVHLHGIWGVGARATAAWSRRTGRPFAISLHGMLDRWALSRSAGKKRVSSMLWEGTLLREAAFLHALAESERQSIAKCSTRPIVTIPNGIDLPALEHIAARSSDTRKVLLFIGRLHPKKGLSELLRAWAGLSADIRSGWLLRIAGWDEIGLLDTLNAAAIQLGITASVEFVGPVYGDAKDKALRSATAFILPSYSEGLPMSVLEAWAYGLPVLMTDACNLPQGFARGAAIEIVVDPPGMIPVLETALANAAALQAIGQRGRTLAAQDHSWSAIADDMHDAYAAAIR